MLTRQRILIVDDDPSISDLVSLYLIKEQYDTKIAADGETALACFEDFDPSLIILDLMLPGIDGYGVCREIRTKSKVPIIILSAKGDTFDKVLALEMGADDYMEKPFDTKELVARVKAVLRRTSVYSAPETESKDVERVIYPGLTINITEYNVTYNDEFVEMPPKEIELLYILAKNPNHVFTREQLLDKVWGYDYVGDSRTVVVRIGRIREKIKDHDVWSIATIWGVGYKFILKDGPKI